jgi:uncharacterized OB-fold protein
MSTSAAAHTSASVERLHADCWRIVDGERVELIASVCTQCGTSYLPKALCCVRCGNRSFKPQALSPRGTLYTYSIVHGSGGVWPDVYAVGYVDFPEGVRVFGHLRDTSPETLHVGAQVGLEEGLLYRQKDGTEVTCYRFFVSEKSGK